MDAGTTVQITMPEMGESVTEGTILEWLKAEGDPVEADEGIVEVSTDKVDTEIPAPASGILAKILVGPDQTVPPGTVLCRIAPVAAGARMPAGEPGLDEGERAPAQAPQTRPAEAGNGAANATPVAARIADANGLDVTGIEGTG